MRFASVSFLTIPFERSWRFAHLVNWSFDIREECRLEGAISGQPVKLVTGDVSVIGISSLALRKSGESADIFRTAYYQLFPGNTLPYWLRS